MQQVVCTKCRCSNQFGTIFCRNCGKKLPDLDMNHPDRKIQNEAKNIFKRLIKLIIFLAVLAFLGALVVPFGFETEPKMKKQAMEDAVKNYDLMKKRLAKGIGFNAFVMPPPEAGYIATQMMLPEPPKTDEDEEAQPEEETEVAAEDPGKITCSTNNDELTIVYTKMYYKVLQCRIEITGKFHLEEIESADDKKRRRSKKPETQLIYTMTAARLGHIKMPKLFFEHMKELFRTMVFNRKIERTISLVEDVKVSPESVTVVFKKQIK